MRISRITGPAIVACLLVALSPLSARSQAPKDDDLDKLLEKLEKKTKPEEKAKPADDSSSEKARTPDASKAKPEEAKPAEKSKDDDEVDDLLKKLGDAPIEPKTQGKAPSRKPDDRADQPSAVKPDDQPLDDRLEELSGRRKKKADSQQSGDKGGPLDDAIKKMREVQKKLGEPDTGEDTQAKQKQIVMELDRILQMARVRQGKSQVRSKPRPGSKPGDQAGNQPGNNPGSTPGMGDNKTIRPKNPPKNRPKNPVLTEKNIWGHLQDALREEMANVFGEEPLPSKAELVKRYYDAVSKKGIPKEN